MLQDRNVRIELFSPKIEFPLGSPRAGGVPKGPERTWDQYESVFSWALGAPDNSLETLTSSLSGSRDHSGSELEN